MPGNSSGRTRTIPTSSSTTAIVTRRVASTRLMELLTGRATSALAASAILFIILFRRSSVVRFYARMIGYIIAGIISSVVGITVSPFMWALGRPGMTNWVVARTMKLIGPVLSGMRCRIEGQEILDRATLPAVLVCNHQSSLDVLGMGYILPPNVVVMGKKEIKWVPILGWFMALANNVFIDRKNRGHAIETMGKVAVYLKEHKYGLWLFPEGTRSHQVDDTLMPFKKGAFHLAVQGQIPIVPIIFSTYQPCYQPKKSIFDAGVITIKVLEPIPTTGMTTADVDALLEKTRDAMLAALQSIKTIPASAATEAKKLQ
ncbi:1-acylglycerol-3-phosphate O-acyltransferase [Thoreauomyces humboldtii]|nr:1-acylglycerol-3-phosphate O-acyltransferase [Thoreauomyces humboldtii]